MNKHEWAALDTAVIKLRKENRPLAWRAGHVFWVAYVLTGEQYSGSITARMIDYILSQAGGAGKATRARVMDSLKKRNLLSESIDLSVLSTACTQDSDKTINDLVATQLLGLGYNFLASEFSRYKPVIKSAAEYWLSVLPEALLDEILLEIPWFRSPLRRDRTVICTRHLLLQEVNDYADLYPLPAPKEETPCLAAVCPLSEEQSLSKP